MFSRSAARVCEAETTRSCKDVLSGLPVDMENLNLVQSENYEEVANYVYLPSVKHPEQVEITIGLLARELALSRRSRVERRRVSSAPRSALAASCVAFFYKLRLKTRAASIPVGGSEVKSGIEGSDVTARYPTA